MDRGIRIAMTLALAVLAARSAALGQDSPPPAWSWPERAENLRQLPEEFPPERLRAVMTGFTRSLGVRCSYCHVGEEGEPLSSYDFPSDDNPMKVTARKMLEMLGDINDHLDGIEPSGPRVNMWCFTCHRGQPRPITLGDALLEALREAQGPEAESVDQRGIEAMAARYRELRERYYGSWTYDFSERSLDRLGYQLLASEEPVAAIAIFRLNAEHHPESASVWDSLAEGYLESGQTELADIYYRKSLELDPDNANALEKLRRIALP